VLLGIDAQPSSQCHHREEQVADRSLGVSGLRSPVLTALRLGEARGNVVNAFERASNSLECHRQGRCLVEPTRAGRFWTSWACANAGIAAGTPSSSEQPLAFLGVLSFSQLTTNVRRSIDRDSPNTCGCR